jgi:hypothetical protein
MKKTETRVLIVADIKVENVIKSCTTMLHITSAKKMIFLHYNMYQSYGMFLYFMDLLVKQREIIYGDKS